MRVEEDNEDILTETINDWEEQLDKMVGAVVAFSEVADDVQVKGAEYDMIVDSMFGAFELAKVGEMHLANLISIATSTSNIFTFEEKDRAANEARLLLGYSGGSR